MSMSRRLSLGTLALAALTPLAAQSRPGAGPQPAIGALARPTSAGLLTLAEAGRLGFTVQGAGARATGMGGAFIGVADDATAASHNPAGLAQLRTYEFSLVMSQQTPKITYSGMTENPASGGGAGISAVNDNTYTGRTSRKVEYLSFTMPAQVGGRNLVTQISWQNLFDLDQSFSHVADTVITGIPTHLKDEIRQTGRLGILSGAVAFEFSPRILAGLSYNRWSGSWAYQGVADVNGGTPGTVNLDQRLEGQNWNLGLMWRTDTVRVGLTYRTGFMGRYRISGEALDGTLTPLGVTRPQEDVKVRWPWTLGAGASWRPLPQLLLALDWSRTPWSRSNFEAQQGSSLAGRTLFNPFVVNTGTDLAPVYTAPLPPVPDATTWHVGAEYLFFWGPRIVPVRLGWFKEPQPYLDNVTGSTRELKGLTLGVGIKQGPLAFDLAYKRAEGSRYAGVPTDLSSGIQALGASSLNQGLTLYYPLVGTEKVTNHQLKASVIYQFKGEGLRAFFRKVFIGD